MLPDSGCDAGAAGALDRCVLEALPTEGSELLIFTGMSFSRWSYSRGVYGSQSKNLSHTC